MKRVWRELRPFRWIIALAIVYGIAHVVLAQISAHRGILAPDGDVDRGYAAFAIAMLGFRIALVVLAPMVVTYRLAMRLSAQLDRHPADQAARVDEQRDEDAP